MTISFEQWMRVVDISLQAKCGLTHMDIDDWCYRDAYDRNVSPQVAAARALKAAQEGY